MQTLPHNPAEVHVAAATLFDVVVLAGGAAANLVPLCQSTPKPLLMLCNRPLIWYCLKPWVEQGCREFYLCVHKPYEGIRDFLQSCPQLDGVTLHFVEVPEQLSDDTPSDTCDALLAYAKFKEHHCKESADYNRDVLLLSCDTILPNVDVAPFISNFYSSFCSTAVMLARATPKKEEPKKEGGGKGGSSSSSGAKSGKGGKGGKAADDSASLPHFPEEHSFCILEDTSIATSYAHLGPPPGRPPVNSFRLHYICEKGDAPQQVMPGFLARRPNLDIAADLVDVHVYLMRHWVIDVVRANVARAAKAAASGDENAEPGWRNIALDVVPTLANLQYPLINKAAGISIDVAGRLNYEKPIPKHWVLQHSGTRCVSELNAMQSVLPRQWDVSRVFATIYEPSPNSALVRVNTVEKFQAASRFLLEGLSEAPSVPLASMAASALRADLAALLRAGGSAAALNPRFIKLSALQSLPPPDATIVNSVIGRNVKIGPGCTITNSTIMENVVIGSRCVIVDSVVCPLAELQDNVKLNECLVGANSVLTAQTYDGETFAGPEVDGED